MQTCMGRVLETKAPLRSCLRMDSAGPTRSLPSPAGVPCTLCHFLPVGLLVFEVTAHFYRILQIFF